MVAFGGYPAIRCGFDQDRAGQAEQSGRVGEDSDDVGAAFDFLDEPFDCGLVDQIFFQWLAGRAGEGEEVVGLTEHVFDLGSCRPSMVATTSNCSWR